MKPRVYLETSVISYLTARPSRDVVTLGRQQDTRDWWENCRSQFELTTSEVVVEESGFGDADAARQRLQILKDITRIAITNEARGLFKELIISGTVPPRAADDAMHLAIAASHGIQYLLTWNCRHIANASLRTKIERACRAAGLEPPTMCTPAELLGD